MGLWEGGEASGQADGPATWSLLSEAPVRLSQDFLQGEHECQQPEKRRVFFVAVPRSLDLGCPCPYPLLLPSLCGEAWPLSSGPLGASPGPLGEKTLRLPLGSLLCVERHTSKITST